MLLWVYCCVEGRWYGEQSPKHRFQVTAGYAGHENPVVRKRPDLMFILGMP